MTTVEFDIIWTELEEPLSTNTISGVVIRRIFPEKNHDFFLGFEKSAFRRMLLVRINKKDTAVFEQLPEFRGFELIMLKFPDEEPDKIMLSLTLMDKTFSEFFSILCEDLVFVTSKEPDPKRMVELFRERLLQWKQFLDVNGNQGLSAEAQRGLYGELRFLRDILFEHLGISRAISCWQGPLHKNQDFQVSGTGIEVKTSIAKQHQKMHIANELQLDDKDLDALYVYFISLKETFGNGETLPGIVDNIRKIIEMKNEPSSEFETLIFKAGYLDKHRSKYNKTGYHDRDIRIFLVNEKFPRIIERDLKPGIGDVHYTIDLAICRKFQITNDDFISEFEWIKNGS